MGGKVCANPGGGGMIILDAGSDTGDVDCGGGRFAQSVGSAESMRSLPSFPPPVVARAAVGGSEGKSQFA